MNHTDVLYKAADTLNERAQTYGDLDPLFADIAALATIALGKAFSKYDISVVMECLKMARRKVSPLLEDNYIDQVNYTAFSAQFAVEAFTHTPEEDTAAPATQLSPKETLNAQDIDVHFDGVTTLVRASMGH